VKAKFNIHKNKPKKFEGILTKLHYSLQSEENMYINYLA
jgi:hypothetical protein